MTSSRLRVAFCLFALVAANPECISHATLKCINDASSFWPRCDPSQSKQDNFPPLHGRTAKDYGHFCTQSWVDALNRMLSDPVINKCADRESQIKLLSQIAVETGYFTTLFQPADAGAGLVHMIPGNWPVNAQDMEVLFGGDFVQRQAAAGAKFFQTPSDGWLSVAAWFKRTNGVIPGCGKDLFEEAFTTQTKCILGRPNDRNEALNIVSSCFGSNHTTTTTTRGGNSGCSGAPCPDTTLCRSKWGYCGASPDHCNNESIWKAGGCRPISSITTTSSNTLPPTITTTSTTTEASASIQSGDILFLKTHAGHGKHIDVEGSRVRARWQSQGAWQALAIETRAGGSIKSGDTIYLRSHAGVHIDVTGTDVQARWHDLGHWQALSIEKKFGGGAILPDDLVCLRSQHTGKYLNVEDEDVRAQFEACGDVQTMLLQKEVSGALFSGDSTHLVAHTAKLIHVEGSAVGASWAERGVWQTLTIENYGGRVIFSGDLVFIKAHTGALFDVEDASVQCRWNDRGDWQKFIVERMSGEGAVMPGDTIFLLSVHTGMRIEVEGENVRARWQDAGTWQALTIEKASTRRLAAMMIV